MHNFENMKVNFYVALDSWFASNCRQKCTSHLEIIGEGLELVIINIIHDRGKDNTGENRQKSSRKADGIVNENINAKQNDPIQGMPKFLLWGKRECHEKNPLFTGQAPKDLPVLCPRPEKKKHNIYVSFAI
ncbi:uncharacterized protein LOC143249755 [Tachypleus tridentatus]|uniref:uncharacterized protein LOC143249755 n=1 Tax=Tachypleus tridentatus TaxID=6853 RepID=UPI003FD239E9